ncbi:MAG: MXAN_6640 family putative metalloprotease [Gaiellaceae bacterium]
MLFSARARFLASAAAVTVLAFAGSAAASERSLAAGAPDDTLTRALTSGQITGAQYALQRALALLAPRLGNPRYASAVAHADPREATMALRDLAVRVDSLSKSDRRLAKGLLARPTDGASEAPAGYVRVSKSNRKRLCTPRFCVHWVTSGSEKPSLVDRNRNGKPDYVDKTVKTMNKVWQTEIGKYGYKKPLKDSSSGPHNGGNPNGRIDIFIAQIGNRGLYGYCATDDPRINRNTRRQSSAYCVFDNDYRPTEFRSGANRLEALQVTAAHEFFHAIQLAYDGLFEDRAFMEGTATWMEDEVFPAVNDNLQYLQRGSPMDPVNNSTRGPWIPLDAARPSTQYGTWIWYRFLSEVHGRGIIRQFWNRSIGRANYGFKSIAAVLAARGTSLQAMLALFGTWNTAPALFYREGALYPTAGAIPGGTGGSSQLDPGSPGRTLPFDMLHLSNDYVLFKPNPAAPAGSLLNIGINFPPGIGVATVIVFDLVGNVASTTTMPLDVSGDAAPVPFLFDPSVSKVVVVITNAGNRFTCNRGRIYSCSGIPRDDYLNGEFVVTAQA